MQDGHFVRCEGVAVQRVVALHIQGVVRDTADTEVNEVIDVETFACNTAVRGKQDAEGVGTATEEDLGVGEIRSLHPGGLGVPRDVGPLTGCCAWVAL